MVTTTIESGVPGGLEETLRTLAEAAELAKSIRIELTDEYLALIAKVEALPQNRSGADKSGVERSAKAFREHYLRARRM